MRDKGIGSWPTRRARMAPDRPAVTQDGRDWSYRDVEERSNRLARGLRDLGVKRGDRVAYLGLNSVYFIETMFATAKLGAVSLPLNTRLTAAEYHHILEDSGTSVLVWDDPFGDVVADEAIAGLGLSLVAVQPSAQTPSLPELVERGSGAPVDEPIELDDLFMLQYTSGTSGKPKGVMLTHGNVTWNVFNVLIDLDTTHRTCALIVPPLFHTGALNMVFLPVFMKGGRCVLHQSFDPGAVLDAIEQERVTFFFGVPAMFVALSQDPRWEQTDLSSVEELSTGSAPMPKKILDDLAARGLGVVQGYGLTEAAPSLTMLRKTFALEKIGSVGTPSFFADVRLRGVDGSDVGPGESGEILAQGPNITPGYWHNPEATEATFTTDGWLRTGDLGRLDDDGFLTIVDRVKDMIISGGENIYPAEVEQAIFQHPAIHEAAVVAVPDERWGEVGRAVVTLRPGASLSQEELLEFLGPRLARYKLPKSVVIVDELPHTATGKILKREIRKSHGNSTTEASA